MYSIPYRPGTVPSILPIHNHIPGRKIQRSFLLPYCSPLYIKYKKPGFHRAKNMLYFLDTLISTESTPSSSCLLYTSSVHRVPLHTLWIGVWMIRVLRTGFPHSDICGPVHIFHSSLYILIFPVKFYFFYLY